MIFAAITQTKFIAPHELYPLCEAIEAAAAPCCDAYGLERIAVVIHDDPAAVPKDVQPMVFVADDTDPGAVAAHFPGGYSRVHVDRTSALIVGDDSAFNGACHEADEARVDVNCDQWVPHPTRPGVEVALEVSDPVQDSFEITIKGVTYSAANFVLPSWWKSDGTEPFDHAGRLSAPGQVGPNGYLVLRNPTTGETWLEGADGQPYQMSATKALKLSHPMSRTNRRMGGKIAVATS